MLIWICSLQGLCLSRKIKSFPGLFNIRQQTIQSKPSFFRKESTSFIFHPRMLMLRYQWILGHCPVLITHLWYQQEHLHLGQKLELDRWVPFFCRCDLAGDGEWISNRSKPSFLSIDRTNVSSRYKKRENISKVSDRSRTIRHSRATIYAPTREITLLWFILSLHQLSFGISARPISLLSVYPLSYYFVPVIKNIGIAGRSSLITLSYHELRSLLSQQQEELAKSYTRVFVYAMSFTCTYQCSSK